MQLELVHNARVKVVELTEGRTSVGGGVTDGLHLDGLPPHLLTLRLEAGQLTVFAERPMRIGETLFPARVPRLLLEGEYIKLPNDLQLGRRLDAQKRTSRKLVGTAMVVQELLSGDLQAQTTRAATLTCVTGLDRGRVFPLPFEENVVGRGDEATVRIRDRSVSRRHVRVVRQGKHLLLRVVSSAMNGVYVNGLLLRRDTKLQSGDVIELGQTVLRYDESETAVEDDAQQTVLEPLVPPSAPPSVSTAPPNVPSGVDCLETTTPLRPRRQLGPEAVLIGVGGALMLLGLLTAGIMAY